MMGDVALCDLQGRRDSKNPEERSRREQRQEEGPATGSCTGKSFSELQWPSNQMCDRYSLEGRDVRKRTQSARDSVQSQADGDIGWQGPDGTGGFGSLRRLHAD